ncbi:uncharacterized protein LOC141659750 [Apium graveolens]|uniref:uncharacterized protein LOC141659750 n=1 Tax=Apium graveolens TaxID=4045 RepID=UPI003D7A6B10
METNKGKESSFSLSYPILTKTNYTTWAMKMRVLIQAHGVWDAVEPKDTNAAIEDKMDKRALAIIYQGIGEDLLMSIADKMTSKTAWEAIKTVHLGANKVKKAKAQTLKAEFESLVMKDTEQLDDFCMKMNSLVTNIRMSRGKCFNCHNHGYFASECPKPRRDREQRAEAYLTQITDDEPALLVAEFDKIDNNRGTKLNTEEDNMWYLDNGASSHMTGHRGKFKDLDETVMGQVKFGDRSMIHIKGRGTVKLVCKNGEERELKDV